MPPKTLWDKTWIVQSFVQTKMNIYIFLISKSEPLENPQLEPIHIVATTTTTSRTIFSYM